ncbi:MAG TPA: hypothetical protein VHR41_03755 [Gemmatimonadales bacterium]|jgi:hypothetical protein|nr:hypothetical protein [Gemmatimonadales bacterium]
MRGAAPYLVLMLHVLPAAAQQPPETKLVIQQGGREIGREEFSLRQSRGRGLPGSTISATAKYPATAPTTQLAATLERTPEPALAKFQLDVESAGAVTVILAAGSGARLIVRTVAKGSESGRELPGGPDVVLLDDSVYSLYIVVADLATPAGRPLTAIFPRTGRRVSFTARREPGGNGGAKVTLTGDLSGTLLTDAQGGLQRLELPGQGILVTRAE